MKKLLLVLLLISTVISPAQNVPGYVPTNGLIGWWPFNGNAYDESGNGHHGIPNGPALDFNRAGAPNASYFFDGNNIKIDTPVVSTVTNAMSVCLWSRFDSIPNQTLFRKNFNNNNQDLNQLLYHYYTPSSLGLRIYNESSWYVTYQINDPESWNHYCWYLQDSITELYVNGVSQGVQNIGIPFSSTSGEVFLGVLDGYIDDVGIWDRVLSSTEVEAVYKGKCTLFDTVLTMDTIHFNDTIYTNVFDTAIINVYDTSYVTAIDTVLLSVTDTLLIDVSLIGVNPIQFEYQVKVYPNPTNNVLNVDIPSTMVPQSYFIELSNPLGQIVNFTQLNQLQTQINISSLGTTGSYILRLKDSSFNVVDTKTIILY